MLSFGDPRPFAGLVRDAGAKLIVQVTSLDEARQALDVGADVIVAQGLEAGGHGGRRSTLPFVPSVVDLAGPVPVLAADGIADGRGLAAALVLGAAGALIGTRFIASSEALARAAVKEALVKGHGEDTESTRVHDIATGVPWPQQYPGRAIRNAFGDRWRGREAELAADAGALRRYREAVAADDPDAVPVWAGEDIDLIHEIEPAGAIVATLAADAESALALAQAG
jgi:nitronate monooxygenase